VIPKIICLHGFRAGNGKTVIALNLAHWLATMGKPVLVIDADFQAPAIQDVISPRYCKELPGHLLPDYLSEVVSGTADLVAKVSSGKTFHCLISAYPGKVDFDLLGRVYAGYRKGMRTILSLLKTAISDLARVNRYEYVLLDSTPGAAVTSLMNLMYLADIVVQIVRAGALEHLQTSAYMTSRLRNLQEISKKRGKEFQYYLLINEIVKSETNKQLIEKYHLSEEPVLASIPFYPELRLGMDPVIKSAEDPTHPFSQAMEGIARKEPFG